MKKLKPPVSLEKAREIGKEMGINWQVYPLDEFKQGLSVELEHGSKDKKTDVTHNDATKTAKIVLAHLKESKSYYTKLKKVEHGKTKATKKEKRR